MYLVDTSVLSVGASAEAVHDARLRVWMDAQSKVLFLSIVSLAEIEAGIAKLDRLGASRRAADLRGWRDAVVHLYGERIIGVDLPIALEAGRMTDRSRAAGQNPGFPDILIAATAAVRGCAVVTRNLRHFAPTGVALLDPDGDLPG